MAAQSQPLRQNRAESSGQTLIRTVTFFWVTVGLLCIVLAVLLANGALAMVTLYATGIVSLLMAVLLTLRKAWARPAAVVYHLWLGGLLLVGSIQSVAQFNAVSEQLPTWLTANTWATLGRFILVAIAVLSLVMAYLLEQESAWSAFSKPTARKRAAPVCDTCGATKQPNADGEPGCAFCDNSVGQIYFLQPVLKNARRIPLEFEAGHERIRIGRTVGNGEAWIDAGENKRYRTISRHHADIELDLKTGEMTIHKAFTSQEVLVDNQSVLMSAPVKLGSMIQLGKVQFVLGNSDYEPTLAYFVDQSDENRRYLLRFNGLDNEQTIGRARDNDIVLADKPDVSHTHAAIIFDPSSDMFFIRNESERRPIYIDGHLLEPGRTTELSNDELIIVQLGAHNFNFLPVLYQPRVQEMVHA